jgi:hypothetical protein
MNIVLMGSLYESVLSVRHLGQGILEAAYCELRRHDLLRRVAPLGSTSASPATTSGATPSNRAAVRSGHCGSGNRCWRPEFYQRSRYRTLRTLSCSRPSNSHARVQLHEGAEQMP